MGPSLARRLLMVAVACLVLAWTCLAPSVRADPSAADAAPTPAASRPGTVRLSGRVVDDAGHPVAGAHVELQIRRNTSTGGHADRFLTGAALTAADGSWTFDAPADAESLVAGAWHHQYANDGYLPVAEFSPPTKLLDGTATFTLKRGVPVEGVVLGPDGKPLAGASVANGQERVCGNKVPPQ